MAVLSDAEPASGRRQAAEAARGWVRGLGVWVLGVAAAVVLPVTDGMAAHRDFMGFQVQPMSGIYRVVREVNVRAAPANDADRVAGAAGGTEVEAVGKTQAGWIAVRRAGRDLGFIFETYLKAVTEPPLERDRAGHIVGVAGTPLSGRFLVATNADVRAKPARNAAKRDRLERGTRVEALGASGDGKWVAVRWSGREMGFVARSALLALIDGRLTAPLTGTAKAAKGSCGFVIRFTGESEVEDNIIETANYDVDWQCTIGGKPLTFPGYMFITEGPFQLTDNQIYQISVDLLGVDPESDEAFSTVFLYRRAEGRVAFDSVSIKNLGKAPSVSELPAKSVREALLAAATMAPGAWNADLWSAVANDTP